MNSAMRLLGRGEACEIGARGRAFEVSTVGFDPDRQGIGSGLGAGNPNSSRLFVPQDPTTDWFQRYTFILCGTTVPNGATYHVRGFSQKLEIGVEVAQGDNLFVFERQVVSPDWSFPDGNVTWSILFDPGEQRDIVSKPPIGFNPANRGPSKSTNPYYPAPALLYLESLAARYVAPMSGTFPGQPILEPGTMYDLRNPYQGLWQYLLDVPVTGPGNLYFCASVWQTNPLNRQVFVPPVGFNPNSIGPEDQFVLQFPGAAYRHIGARMLLEIE